jgi:uncharacterized protein YegP (UPF0339 family)
MAYKFELFKDSANEYRFRFGAPNGEIMLQSEGYTQKKSAIDSIKSIQNNSPDADLDDLT